VKSGVVTGWRWTWARGEIVARRFSGLADRVGAADVAVRRAQRHHFDDAFVGQRPGAMARAAAGAVHHGAYAGAHRQPVEGQITVGALYNTLEWT
jgi:hypothetical protein